MFEGTYSPPFYLDLYNFKNGSQDDIFVDSYASIPPPSPTQTEVPTPINHPVPQPSTTKRAKRKSVERTAREPGVLGFVFKTLFSIRATYSREVF
jgi:hypothetical protein